MFDSKTIIKTFNRGGYKAIRKEFEGKRMPKSTFKELTAEAKKIWHRFLGWRWRKDHPEFIKKQNYYYYKKRIEEKPYKCICVRCGEEFNAARPYYKICGKCPTKTSIKKKEIQMRKDHRNMIAEQAVAMYQTGRYTQKEVAEFFGTYQRQISNWVTADRKRLQNKK